jgi:hypothetical protein
MVPLPFQPDSVPCHFSLTLCHAVAWAVILHANSHYTSGLALLDPCTFFFKTFINTPLYYKLPAYADLSGRPGRIVVRQCGCFPSEMESVRLAAVKMRHVLYTQTHPSLVVDLMSHLCVTATKVIRPDADARA